MPRFNFDSRHVLNKKQIIAWAKENLKTLIDYELGINTVAVIDLTSCQLVAKSCIVDAEMGLILTEATTRQLMNNYFAGNDLNLVFQDLLRQRLGKNAKHCYSQGYMAFFSLHGYRGANCDWLGLHQVKRCQFQGDGSFQAVSLDGLTLEFNDYAPRLGSRLTESLNHNRTMLNLLTEFAKGFGVQLPKLKKSILQAGESELQVSFSELIRELIEKVIRYNSDFICKEAGVLWTETDIEELLKKIWRWFTLH